MRKLYTHVASIAGVAAIVLLSQALVAQADSDFSALKPSRGEGDIRSSPADVDDSRRLAAMRYRAVSEIINRTSSEKKYMIRWQRWNGTWTSWKLYKLSAGFVRTHYCLGSSTGEIVFDRYVNDGKVTKRIVTLAVTRALATTDVKDVNSERMAFTVTGTTLKLYKVNRLAEKEARKFKGVVSIHNPTNQPTMPFRVRWRRVDGRWTTWKKHTVRGGYVQTLSMKGANGCEIEYDCIGGDKQFTGKRYALDFNTIPSWKRATKADGRRYKFRYVSRTNIKLYRQ